ncbi:hypothetical protein IKG10_01955 [Candidatus Saccharibacteria bacterium]|nr:hypothetical protein [Candidatus Saccharibacteria bacterium]
MNIYLDIDGVLLGTKSPEKDIVKLVKYILKHYPDSTYWLTTHCKGEINRAVEWLRQNNFPEELADEMDKKIKLTDWKVLKTEGIDMDQDFVWFDDSLFEAERRTLEAYHALDGYYRMDPKNSRSAKKALKYLKSI